MKPPGRILVLVIAELWIAVVGQDETEVRLHGAGASFPSQVYFSWISTFRSYRSPYVYLDVEYDAVGSSEGKRRMKGERPGIEEDYAGSDSLLSKEELEEFSDLRMLPTMAGAVVLGYNLPEVGQEELLLSMEAVVGIYNGSIDRWNHSVITDLNPNLNLPNRTIIVIVRADKSGTTHIFTGALSSNSPEWAKEYGTFSTGYTASGGRWKDGVVTYGAHQTRGMSGLILSFAYSIGYLSIADAKSSNVAYCKMLNRDGVEVTANISSVQAVMDEAAAKIGDDLTIILNDYSSPQGWPIAGYTFFIVRMSTMTNCRTAIELVRYILWFMTEEQPRSEAEAHEMVPLSDAMVRKITDVILKRMTCDGKSLWKAVQEQIASESKDEAKWLIPVVVSLSIVSVLLVIGVAYGLYRFVEYRRILRKREWEIEVEEIVFYQTHRQRARSKVSIRSCTTLSSSSITELSTETKADTLEQVLHWPGKWKQHTIGLRLVEIKTNRLSDRAKMKLLWMKNKISCVNVLAFHGMASIEKSWYSVNEYCSKGALKTVLKEEKYNFKVDFKLSLSGEVANGLMYLHSKDLVHGHLRTSNCLLDYKWNVKIADWEFCEIYSHVENKGKNPLLKIKTDPMEVGENEAALWEFWVAPEILKSDYAVLPSSMSDVYSFGLIMNEIFTRKEPFQEVRETLTNKEICRAIVNNHLRPLPSDEMSGSIRELLDNALSDDPTKRPTADQVLKQLRVAHSFKKSVIDSMMETTEEYIGQLEEQLTENRGRLSEAELTLQQTVEAAVPIQLLNNFTSTDLDAQIVRRMNTCLVCLKLVQANLKENQIWSAVNNVNYLLEHFGRRYGAFPLNIGTGYFILVFGLDDQDVQKCTVDAANAALSLVSQGLEFFTDTNGISQSGFQVGIHQGSLHVCVVTQSVPRCHLLGETVEAVTRLAQLSKPMAVLVSRAFHNACDTSAKGQFVFEKVPGGSNGSAQSTTTYWLKCKQQKCSAPKEHKSTIPIIV